MAIKHTSPAIAPRRGRPPARSFSPADIATLLDVDVSAVIRALDLAPRSFFPHASKRPDGWTVPECDVRRLLGGSLEQLLSARTLAGLLELSYFTIRRAVKLPPSHPGHIRAETVLGQSRIPASEYWRLRGRRRPAIR